MTTRTPEAPARSAGMPDRRPPYVRWTFHLVCVCLVLLLGILAGMVYLGLTGARRFGFSPGDSPVSGELRRDLGGKLLGAGLPGQAVEQYRLYLSETDLPPDRRATLAYTIGKLLMEEGRYEEALSWLFQVEMLDPASEVGPEAGAKIVACLERLGRFAQAQYTLEARSGPPGPVGRGEVKGDLVVARIGNETIPLRELDEAIDALPPWVREPLQDPGRKKAFLEQYVAEELLVRKARKLELDKDPQVRKLADRTFRQLLAQKVLESEIQEKVRLTGPDVERHFEANRDRFGQKPAYKIRVVQAPLDRLPEIRSALDRGGSFPELAREASVHPSAGEGGLIDEWVEEGMDPTGMGNPGALWEALSSLREGEIAGPLAAGDTGILIRVEARRPPREPALEEVRQQVEQDLYRQRVEQATQELIHQALQVSDVRLFPEVLGQSQAPAPEEGTSVPVR